MSVPEPHNIPQGFRGINIVNEKSPGGPLPEPGGLPAPGSSPHSELIDRVRRVVADYERITQTEGIDSAPSGLAFAALRDLEEQFDAPQPLENIHFWDENDA